MLSALRRPLVGAVSRLPATVHTKLLIAFVGPVLLLVLLVVVGLKVVGDSNDRVERLGTLQLRATAYNDIQTYATQLGVLLGLRAERTNGTTLSSATLVTIDTAIASTIAGFQPKTEVDNLTFAPPADELAALERIGEDFRQFTAVMDEIINFDMAGTPDAGLKLQAERAKPLSDDLKTVALDLVAGTAAETSALIAENRDSSAESQRLFVAIALISIVLALALGYVLSWSIIAPIRLTESRLSAIAQGDFGGHLDVPNRDELGSLAAKVNGMNDELGRLYRELENASRHKSEFLANMSHELRTPLNGIIGFSDVLIEQIVGELNPKQLDYLGDIRTSGRHLLALINDILDLSKVEAGRMELSLSTFSLPNAIESGITMVRERAARQGVELAVDLQLDDTAIYADERKVKQVLFNLLSNAVKFTPAGGHVTVKARVKTGNVSISVQDTGMGIARQDQARIFEAFQQVEAGPNRAQEGTGLGLGLARRLVELHGGTITVESELGHGSTFTVLLPAPARIANPA